MTQIHRAKECKKAVFWLVRLKTAVIVAFFTRIAHFDMEDTFYTFISCDFVFLFSSRHSTIDSLK